MPSPRKKDYSSIASDVVEEYKKIRNVLTVARQFHISPYTAKTILEEANIAIGRSGKVNHHWKKAPLSKDSCRYCHKYSKVTSISGYCLCHRRTVAARNVEPCFV